VERRDRRRAGRHTAGAVYTGLALAHNPFGEWLLAANFRDNRIDVYDGRFRPVTQFGQRLFSDPSLPAGYAPYNVTEVGGRVVVAYARQDAARTRAVAGAGTGFVDVYTTFGVLVRRIARGGALNAPWGLAVAPAGFGGLAGALLVANSGDGRINAYDLGTGRVIGAVRSAGGEPIRVDGLWGLLVGNAVAGGPDAVWFSAGPGARQHGLLGLLRPAADQPE
jgi:uncharacterized protein (TIGR03118 family)